MTDIIPVISGILYPADLPIVQEKERIIAAVCEHQVVIIAGDTGSGKTTQLPKMCLEAGRGRVKRIGCTQPRRIAAVSVAGRVAEEMGNRWAGLVGHKIRFQDRTGPATRIKFMTDGILLAETQTERLLKAYDTIIVDEAHERSLNIDFLLGILKRVLPRRPDLKVIITSATIDTEKFARGFGGAPVIEVSGRMYPVEVRYQPLDPEKEEEGDISYVEQAVAAVKDIVQEEPPGDILVFLPTEQDIREAEENLSATVGGRPEGAVILPLFGRMSVGDQNRVFQPMKGRKIVLATNIAETSVTVPGIRYVVDAGLARLAIYNPRARTSKLPILPVSRASADQRKGRCGRVGPGVCIRLYAEDNYLNRPEFTPPEIQRSNLAEVILRMISLRLGDPTDFPFLDPPSQRAVRDGYNLLHELGAIRQPARGRQDEVRLTGPGRLMARLPLDPRISRMIIEAKSNNCLREVMVIAAGLSIQDPRVRPANKEKEADAMHARFVEPGSDFLTLLKIWDTYHDVLEKMPSQSRMRKFCKSHYLAFQRMREWRDIYEQIRVILAEEEGFIANSQSASYDAVHRSLLSGNLRNIAVKKAKNMFSGAQNRDVMVFPGSGLFNKTGQWIMAAELVETSNLYARTVAEIRPEWLEPLAGNLCRYSYADPHWEKRQGRVVASEKVTLFGLVIVPRRPVNFARIEPTEARRIFIQEALVNGELRGSYGFLDHNRSLVAKHQQLEDRLRQRDILIDDYGLFLFYDQRLPAEVWDKATLNAFLKKQSTDRFLWMTEADILRQEPARAALMAYPESIGVGDIDIKLSYKFEPGAEDDGVSAYLPVSFLAAVSPQRFEWLVPGLLPDKIAFLLKGLPKQVRKQLIPVAQTAQELADELSEPHGSLLQALEDLIFKKFRVRVERAQWPMATLPDHFRMRFCLVDDAGKTIKATRDFAELTVGGPVKTRASGQPFAPVREKWERGGIADWDFAGLPDKVSVTNKAGDLTGFLFPALTSDGQGKLAVRLCESEAESRQLTRAGLLLLYKLVFPRQCKSATEDFALSRDQWALHQGLDTRERFNEQLTEFILTEVFETGTGQIPDRQDFDRKVSEVQEKGIYSKGREALDRIIMVLQERRATLDMLSRCESMKNAFLPITELRQRVDDLLPPDFLTRFNMERILAAERYLKALQLRMERALAAPAKDRAKAAQLAPYTAKLKSFEEKMGKALASLPRSSLDTERQQLVDELRAMVEEFAVSLFAPEIKTAFPVSAKRLDAKIKEVERIF